MGFIFKSYFSQFLAIEVFLDFMHQVSLTTICPGLAYRL